MACLFADNSSPHVYLRLLASLLPPSTRQPGSVAVLFGQTLPGGVHLFGHCPDHCAGCSLMASLFADNSSPHVYLRLLASLLPPSTRQPGPVAVLLGQTLKLSLIFHQSLTLFWSTEKHLVAASPEFSSAYLTTESLKFKSYLLFLCCTGAMAIINTDTD